MPGWRQQTWRAAWALTLGAVLGGLYLLGLFDAPELKTLDVRFLMRGTEQPRSPILIVAIDEDSFDELQLQWPWPRSLHASLIDIVRQGRPLAIGFDITFDKPDRAGPQEDRALAVAVGRDGNVVLAAFFSEVEGSLYLKENLNPPLPSIRERAWGFGFNNVLLDSDGFVRQAMLAQEHQGTLRSSFAYRLFQLVSGAAEPRSPGQPMLINFRGPAGTFPVVPYYQVVRGEVGPETFAGKVVLVGGMAASLQDLFPTPFAGEQRMSGVEIQANLLETLLQGNPVSHPPRSFHLFLVCIAAPAAALIGFRFRPLKAFGLIAGLTAAYGLFCLGAFLLWSLWLEVVPTTSALVMGYGVVVLRNYVQEEREKRRLSRYFSPAILEEIVRHPGRLSLGSSRPQVTVLFADIRGFTSIAERLAPEEVAALLQEFFSVMTEIVFRHGGTVDKFIGDAIMALYGAPLEFDDHAARALRTALEMQEETAALESRWVARCGEPLRIGIGINTGDAIVGTMGSVQRLEFTAIGDTVNLASRLEGLAKEFKVAIVIGEETRRAIGDLFPVHPLGELKVKGRGAPVEVYAVDTEPRRTAPRVPVEVPIAVNLDREFAVYASMKNLSTGGAAVRSPSPLPLHGEVGIRFKLPESPVTFAIRARVAWSRGDESGVQFLGLGGEEQRVLEEVVTRLATSAVPG
ncbi:MAG: CHASE2 domain-containing protein [candidate division NC10 bacterium]|nr:CHASE2 domain-containing protein [candidate division NC10 bacterium]